MKSKVTEWGNSHGIRMTGSMMNHLIVNSGEHIDWNFTERGIEFIKNGTRMDMLLAATKEALEEVMRTTNPIREVSDPYSESDVAYLVIVINSSKPLIREVQKNTINSYSTLSEAKEVAHRIIQKTISEATVSLSELRQLGISKIEYIRL